MTATGQSHPAADLEQARKGADLLRATLVGVAAGISASFVMNQFQAALGSLPKNGDSDSDEGEKSKPTTVKAADVVSGAVTGKPVSNEMRGVAGAAVHYGFGALLGGLYGAVGAVEPGLRAGFGTAYGAAAALVADEAMVPAMGLSPPPQETPASSHAYGMVSHLVFGIALEGSRRVIEALVSSMDEKAHGDEADGNAKPASVGKGGSA